MEGGGHVSTGHQDQWTRVSGRVGGVLHRKVSVKGKLNTKIGKFLYSAVSNPQDC